MMPPESDKTPAGSDKTPEEKLHRKQAVEMALILERMFRPIPTTIKIGNGKECQFDYRMLYRMHIGAKWLASDWIKLTDMLLASKAPDATLLVGHAPTVPVPKDGEIGLWIREVGGSMKTMQWCLTTYKLSEKTVTTYAVRATDKERMSLTAVADTLGVLPHTLSSVYYQETPMPDMGHQSFQDAVLFDMLLDIASHEFTPHQHRIEDGSGIQLEIMQALEQIQAEAEAEAEAEAAAYPNKRRRTIKERLGSEVVKDEP